ncbi:hypothetical protein ACJEBK_19940 [Peribacillus frigoritolerans]|uniref:hypothetical protein n=1 Tax=Peribacillus frigoritolerans TaxID=450367 RepID=UPI0007BFC419|nr:hypothetical protein [Peribacillus frigoritolerans]UYZ01205.1 hypothetical protein OJ967_12305 [Peribacillus frigoritolerans]
MRFKGFGTVWDKENNKPLCEFIDGEFKTTEDEVIKTLKKLGYKGEKEKITSKPSEGEQDKNIESPEGE